VHVEEMFAAAGCTGTLHARSIRDVGADGSHGLDLEDDGFGYLPDLAVVPASVMKVQVALAVESMFADGALDPTERVRLGATRRTPGPVGLSLCQDDVEVSLRDLVTLMLTISDNVATDALLHRVGLSAVNALTARLGLRDTAITSTLQQMIHSLGVEAGFSDYPTMNAWFDADPDPLDADRVRNRLHRAAALDPRTGTRTTARDMTRLLTLIWTDRAGPPLACARIRTTMANQLTRHRLAATASPPQPRPTWPSPPRAAACSGSSATRSAS
jgi:beta-lactamase class A